MTELKYHQWTVLKILQVFLYCFKIWISFLLIQMICLTYWRRRKFKSSLFFLVTNIIHQS